MTRVNGSAPDSGPIIPARASANSVKKTIGSDTLCVLGSQYRKSQESSKQYTWTLGSSDQHVADKTTKCCKNTLNSFL